MVVQVLKLSKKKKKKHEELDPEPEIDWGHLRLVGGLPYSKVREILIDRGVNCAIMPSKGKEFYACATDLMVLEGDRGTIEELLGKPDKQNLHHGHE